MAPAIFAAGLSKRYGETLALDALDLDVQAGEVYGYLGPNGAGKTTTIRLLLGLHKPTGGRAELFGVDAWRDPVAASASCAPSPSRPAAPRRCSPSAPSPASPARCASRAATSRPSPGAASGR
jgi:ABC-type multidrug transport system ATPase subunit